MTFDEKAVVVAASPAEYKIDVLIQTELLDRIYTKTRQRIKEKGGMITHDAAMKLVLHEDLQKIKEEMFNKQVDDFAKSYPILAEKLRSKDLKAREEGMRILDFLIEEVESPD